MPTILIIDDERLTGEMLRAVLGPHGQQVLVARSGEEGLKMFREHHPDLVVLDVRMRPMSGIEVLQEIRASDPHIPVLVLTAGATPDEENLARELGVKEFLNKGLSLDVILNIIKRHTNGAVSEAPKGQPTAPEQAAGQGDVLVVDDEPLVGNMVQRYLGRRGYRVFTVSSGKEALAFCEREHLDLIVLDMYMPGMTGLDVLRELRARNYSGPVIMLSASQDEYLLKASLTDGAIDVISKPVDLEKLEMAVSVGVLLGKD